MGLKGKYTPSKGMNLATRRVAGGLRVIIKKEKLLISNQ
jgi:hypothetical protein